MTKDIRKAFGESVGDGDVAGKKSGTGFLGGLGKTIAKGAAILGVGALVGTTISAGMQRAISIEGSQKKLEGLGHSAESITSIMDSALKSVKGTAYGLGDAASVAAMMAAAGVKNGDAMTRTLSTVADVAAISGRSLTDIGTIFGSVAARGKLQGDDMLQLMSSGIPVLQILGTHMGKTSAEVSKMVSAGKIDFQTFADAMNAGLGGSAQKGAETFTGALANARAALGRLGAAFLTPALTAAKPLLVGLTGLVDGFTAVVSPAAEALGRLMVPAAERAGAALTTAGKGLSSLMGSAGQLEGLAGVGARARALFDTLTDGSSRLGPSFASALAAASPLGAAFKLMLPVLPALAGGVVDILAALLPVIPAVTQVAIALGGAMASAVVALTPAIVALVPPLVQIVVALAQFAAAALSNEAVLWTLLSAFGAFKAVQGVAAGISAVTSAIAGVKAAMATAQGVAVAFKMGLLGMQGVQASAAAMKAFSIATTAQRIASGAATAAQWLWNAALSANPIGIVVVAIAALVAALVWFFTQTEVGQQAWAAFTGWLMDTWNTVVSGGQQLWGDLVAWFTGAWDSISTGAAEGWAGILGIIDTVWSAVGPIIMGPIQSALAMFTAVFESIKAVVSAAFLVVVGLFTGNGQLIEDATNGLGSTLSSIWGDALAKIKEAIGGALTAIGNLFTSGWAAVTGATSAAWNSLTSAVLSGVLSAIGHVASLPGRAASALSSLGGLITGIAQRAWVSFLAATTSGIASTLSLVASLPSRALSALAGISTMLSSAGRDLIMGFIKGMLSMASAIKDAAARVVGNAVSSAKAALGIHSPSRVFMELGGYTGEGFTIGLSAEAGSVARAAQEFADAAVPTIPDPWDRALADLSATITPAPWVEPPASARSVEAVAAPDDSVAALLLRLIAAVEAGQEIKLDGDVLVGATTRRVSQSLSSSESGKGRANGAPGLEL